jgi:hypothetical protein
MRLRSIDVRNCGRTMADAGGEDRALLRSNPSARAGAETQAGGRQSDRPLSLLTPPAFSPQSDKPRGLGQSPKETRRTGGTYVNICGLDHEELERVQRDALAAACGLDAELRLCAAS